MANTFQTNTLIEKALSFTWEAGKGFADKISYRTDLFGAAKETGDSVNLRRPSAPKSQTGAMGLNYDLPAINPPSPFTISGMNEFKVPLTIEKRLQYTIEASMEELTLKIDKEEVMRRHIEPAIVSMRDQYNTYLASKVAANAGQVNVASAATGDGFMEALFNARAKMIFRKGLDTAGSAKSLLMNPNITSVVGLANAKVFNAGANNIYTDAELGRLAGFDVNESPLLDTPTIVALGAGAILVTADTAARPTSWVQTWTLKLSGLTSTITVNAGTKIKIKTGSTYINWVSPTGADVGQAATFTVVANATAVAGVITLTLAEPFIPTGDYKNVSADLVPGTSVVELAYAVGTKAPSYAFANDAIVAASPLINIPTGIPYSKRLKFGGLNVLMIEDRGPAGNFQNVTQLIAFVGATVIKPEGITELHLS
jgi:hypothetical protein